MTSCDVFFTLIYKKSYKKSIDILCKVWFTCSHWVSWRRLKVVLRYFRVPAFNRLRSRALKTWTNYKNLKKIHFHIFFVSTFNLMFLKKVLKQKGSSLPNNPTKCSIKIFFYQKIIIVNTKGPALSCLKVKNVI